MKEMRILVETTEHLVLDNFIRLIDNHFPHLHREYLAGIVMTTGLDVKDVS